MLRRFRLLNVVVLVALVLAAFGGSGAALAAPELTADVQIAVDQAAFAADQGVLVHVTISNPNKQPIKILKWYTPVDEVESPLFAVKTGGAEVKYLGPIYKRPAPTGQDYLILKSGESLTFDVDVSADYDFSTSGQYDVRYAVSSANLYSEKSSADPKRVDSMISNKVSVWVEGRAAKVPPPPPPDPTGGTTFNKCTTAQQSDLLAARSQASTYSADARGYLQSNKTGSRYTTWFGAVTAARYSIATNNFTAISSAMDTAAVKFDCGCKKPYYAYVYPTQPYNIYLCKIFWTAPLTGTDSKAGTLIHEMSHFNVVAGTDDYVYGQTGAKNLAITNPDQAVDNADNHEYFAENTPALP